MKHGLFFPEINITFKKYYILDKIMHEYTHLMTAIKIQWIFSNLEFISSFLKTSKIETLSTRGNEGLKLSWFLLKSYLPSTWCLVVFCHYQEIIYNFANRLLC